MAGHQMRRRNKEFTMRIMKDQKGIILIATLIMITILTAIIIALAVLPNNDQKMAGNAQDKAIAQQAANAALEEAKMWIAKNWNNSQTPPAGSCNYPTSLPMQSSNFSMDNYYNASFWTNTAVCSASTTPAKAAKAPQYVLKQLGCSNSDRLYVYQIVARGYGINQSTVAYAEKLYTTGLNGNLSGANSSTPGAKAVTLSGPSMSDYLSMISYSNPTWVPLGGQWGFCGGYPGYPIFGCSGTSSGANLCIFCQRDCAGNLRITGYSGCTGVINGVNIPLMGTLVGPWIPATGGTSSIQLFVQPNYGSSPVTLATYSCSQ